MIEQVRKAIKEGRLLRRGDTVCVAVSGGVDSSVLLYILNAIKEEMSLKLVVCHLNHNLRGEEAARDFKFVKSLAKKFDLPFEGARLLKKDIIARRGESLQEWARSRRLEFLSACADKHGASSIALGHNMDDQAETVLMRLVKGASLRGLAGIAPKRERFIRPILGLSRAKIEAFAAANSIDFVEDSSNKSNKYLRNRMRHELMPMLADYNPRVSEAISRSALLLREDEAYLSDTANGVLKDALVSKKKREVALDRKVLMTLSPSILRRVFTGAVYTISNDTEPSVYLSQVNAFTRLLKGRAPNASLKLCEGLFVRRDYDNITISGIAPKVISSIEEEVRLSVPGTARIDGLTAEIRATVTRSIPDDIGASSDGSVAFFDLAHLSGQLTVRTFRAGDRLRPMGMKGRKKLKDIFIDEKMAVDKRRATLIVCSDGVIIWAAGARRSNVAPVTKATKKVLKLTLKQKP